jgi:DnaJ-domain-containing protein 1
MLKVDLIIKAFSLCVLIYIIGKVLAPFLGETLQGLFFGTKKKKNSDINFDHMIEQKKSMLRGDGSTSPTGEAYGTTKSRKGRTEEALHKEYSELSKKQKRNPKEEARYNELKSFMAMIDSLQWGAGPELKSIANKLGQLIGARVEESTLNQNFTQLLQKEVFLGAQGKLKSLSDIQSSLESYTFMFLLFNNEDVQKAQAKKWSMDILCMKKGLMVAFGKKSGQASIKNLISQNNVSLPQANPQAIISFLLKSPGVFKSRLDAANEIKDEAEIFHTLSPMPPLKGKNDREGALKSLGLGPQASLEQIKKQYKKLARLKHPDRLKGKGIPAEFESIATENFTQIKEAYDILIKESK